MSRGKRGYMYLCVGFEALQAVASIGHDNPAHLVLFSQNRILFRTRNYLGRALIQVITVRKLYWQFDIYL